MLPDYSKIFKKFQNKNDRAKNPLWQVTSFDIEYRERCSGGTSLSGRVLDNA
jgi:hypothetical protein